MQADRRALPALLFVLIVGVGMAATLTQLGALRRTAEAPVTITSAVLEPGGGTKDRRERGYHLRYVYNVGASSYPGIVFRTWTSVEGHDPKVCFDPADPRNHWLVDGDVACGVGAMFQ